MKEENTLTNAGHNTQTNPQITLASLSTHSTSAHEGDRIMESPQIERVRMKIKMTHLMSTFANDELII